MKASTSKRFADLREPTQAEAKSIALARERQATLPARTSAKVRLEDRWINQSNPHADAEGWEIAMQDVFATTSQDFAKQAMLALYPILTVGGLEPEAPFNAAMALIAGVAPTNEAEAALAVQIVASHAASLQMTRKTLVNAEAGHIEAANVLGGLATKFARTMTAQVEALAKLRGGGRQIVEHRYISVNAENAVVGDGAQAVFGNVTHGGKNGNEPQPCGTTAGAPLQSAAVPSPDPSRDGVPIPGDAGKEALSHPRRPEPRRSVRAGKRALRARSPD